MKYNKNSFILAGDIGGTKTHLALFSKGEKRPKLRALETYPSQQFLDLESIVECFLKSHDVSISSTCFGVAGPVEDGQCKTTNLPWSISEKKLKVRFKWYHLCLINDLAATAYAIPSLKKQELFVLHRGKRVKEGNLGLIAPGTGLGMALMIFHKNRYVSVPSEGGHSDFAPRNETELALLQYIRESFDHVSIERVLSGPGLFRIYSWLRQTEDKGAAFPKREANRCDSPETISEAALLEKDRLCVKALDLFVSIFGATAGNLALTGLTRGGIYLGGGIAPKILTKLQENIFMTAFADKGRFKDLILEIPVYVILNDRAALLGAAIRALMNQQTGS